MEEGLLQFVVLGGSLILAILCFAAVKHRHLTRQSDDPKHTRAPEK